MRQESGTEDIDSGPSATGGVLCRLLGHRRSGALVFTHGDGIWRSRCKRCGRKMIRVGSARWEMDVGESRSGPGGRSEPER